MDELIWAKWGCGGTWPDVTKRINEIIKSGEEVAVDPHELRENEFDAPNDPVPNHIKKQAPLL